MAVDQQWEWQVLKTQESNTGKTRVWEAEKALAGIKAQLEKVTKAAKSAKNAETAGEQALDKGKAFKEVGRAPGASDPGKLQAQ
eukprot:9928523-Heterocapsa_arctica.AAC.1